MRFFHSLPLLALGIAASRTDEQTSLLPSVVGGRRNVSAALFTELEEFSRIVDISYCVGVLTDGIGKPFQCLSRCAEFPNFELVRVWNTGPLLSDSCGYVALDHDKQRIIVAFRGTYSIANTIVDLSTVPQEYTPYPGSDGDDDKHSQPEAGSRGIVNGIAGHVRRYSMAEKNDPKCLNCTVHMGFHTSWLNTRKAILPDLEEAVRSNQGYSFHLVGHSLGGAVAALAGLDTHARGWDPIVTTFGEPRVGNTGLVRYIDDRFDLSAEDNTKLKYRRVTHIDDPVPLLPLSEWGYAMHAGEIYISKPSLSPDIANLQHCQGDNDPACIAQQDSSVPDERDLATRIATPRVKRDLLASVKNEIYDVMREPWGIPSRYKLWQLLFAHRDYFWRLGLCVPGGDPMGGGGKYGQMAPVAEHEYL
ncbi:Lipase A [Acrodontium crateriforme]|uniref:Lipase A n=1 Tax=Acrodontium crateriforme TaxID=150365 RepID=A0AAQ3R7Z4_9PEZI|nr:Lipase A [Acrodontium crateriforme]